MVLRREISVSKNKFKNFVKSFFFNKSQSIESKNNIRLTKIFRILKKSLIFKLIKIFNSMTTH